MTAAIVILAIFAFLLYVPPILYFKLGWFKRWFHDIMGWCVPDDKRGSWRAGANECAICKHCGKKIMQDSQGNWF